MQMKYRTNWYSSDRIILFQYCLIAILLAVWLPLPFFNFDEHHDGLILSTIRLTKTALIHGGEYPFNQYGPFWAIPFLLLSLYIPEAFLFLGIRFLTVIFYFTSAYLLWKIARLFLTQKLALVVVILFLGSQPFVSDYGSDLVPWPSAVAMPIILAIAYCSILQVTDSNPRIKVSRMPIYVGILLPMVILTRLQVGVLLLIISILTLYFSKQANKFLKFSSGFTGSALVICIYLFHFGWLKDAFYDQIVFGSTYLSADKSTFPKPIFTFVGVALFFLVLLVGAKVLNDLQEIKSRTFFVIFSALSVFISVSLWYLIYSRSISPLSSLVVFTRRFWITVVLSLILFLLMNFIFTVLKKNKDKESSSKFPIALRLLLLFALGFQSQIYPLFDQMHFWWGSPLAFLVGVIVFKEYFGTFYSGLAHKTTMKILGTCLLLISVVTPWAGQISSHKEVLPIAIGKGIYATPQNAQYQSELQNFFHENIEKGTRVLNLCDDTNVFFENEQYVSASRFFVFWGEQMSHAPSIIKSFSDSEPDFVLTCGLTHAPALRFKQEKMQQKILESIIMRPTDPIIYSGQSDKIWRIYRVSKYGSSITQ